MKWVIPRGLRYRTVAWLEGSPPVLLAWPLRVGILVALMLMAAPWPAAREVAFGPRTERSGLKPALRAMLWVWNRSWIPFRVGLGTFFDIGWHLSAKSCEALSLRGFLSRNALKRQCDRAQLELATLREAVGSADEATLQASDQQICSLVEAIFNEARQWAAGAHPNPVHRSKESQPAQGASAKPEKRFDNERTRLALLDFDDLSRQLGLRYFLISGTFLGVVRDGAFIGHDHDIDLGIFEEDLPEELLAALSGSNDFEVTEVDRICLRHSKNGDAGYAFMRSPAIIRLAHRSGISLDLFVHFRDGDVVWHGSSVHRWDNAAFPLADYTFLGRSFKGALDHDRYLNENYGADWRVPKADFNVNFDTPNLSFVGTANALVYFAWMVIHAMEQQDAASVVKYLEMLERLGVVTAGDGRLKVQ